MAKNKRAYFNKLIKELQKLFELNRNNPVLLEEILNELGYRKTQVALRLKEKVEVSLQHLESKQKGDLKKLLEKESLIKK